MIKFPCLQCSANNEAEDADAGQVLLCGNCGAKVIVPVVAKKALPVPPPVAARPAEPKVIERVVYVQQEARPAKQKTSGCAVAVLALLLSFIGYVFYLAFNPPPGGHVSSGGVSDREVIRIAQRMVKGNLRAPSTAKFVDEECSAWPTTNRNWTATIVVDAQNGFGAMLRNRYEVDLWPKYQGADEWAGRIVSDGK